MPNLCEHMYVAMVVFDFLFLGQMICLQNKNAEPLWTHVRGEGRFRFLIFWAGDLAKNKNAEPMWTYVRREGRFRFLIFGADDLAKK